MRLGIMGPLLVADETGREIRLTAARHRALLAALLVRVNRTVSVDELAEIVWDGVPSAGAVRTVRSYVVRVRQALGPLMATRILTRDPGYCFAADEDELDILRFEALCRRGRQAARVGAWTDAHRLLVEALGLWRGVPLEDVPSQLLRAQCVEHLEQARLQALEWRVNADMQLGRHEQVAPELAALVRDHPLRERFHAQLMTALARSGRQAEALEAYRSARQILVEELGIEPGPELCAVHQHILSGQTDHALTRPRPPRAATATAVPRQLPSPPGNFIGRDSELGRLTALAQGTSTPLGAVVISAIDGMAGIGKTALALHAAQRLAGRFPDGQLFLDLHGYTQGHPPRTADEALTWLLQALGVSAQLIPADGEQAAALYRQRLADTRTLIVLDNAATEAQVRPLLPGAGRCLVLITSRRRLKGLDDARIVSLDLLAPPDAIALLCAVIGPDRIPADGPLLGEVAGLCGYLPLALRIVGALVRHRPAWSLEHLAAQLRDQQNRVAALSDGERELAGVFDLSYSSLDTLHRTLFRRLGLTPGPDLDAYAAAALLQADAVTAAGLLEDLVDHNLLTLYAPGRYRLHDLLRAHARTLAETDPAPEREAAVDRLLHYYAHTAQNASVRIVRYPRPEPQGPAPAHAPVLADTDTALAWLHGECPNMETAFTYAHARGLDGHAIALAAGLAEILRTDGPWARALQIHQAAAASAERAGDQAGRASALCDLGRARALSTNDPHASDDLTQAAELYRVLGDRLGEANALCDLGFLRFGAGILPGADQALTRALQLYRTLGNTLGEAHCLHGLAVLRYHTGDFPKADDARTRALELYRALGQRHGEAYILTESGRALTLRGDYLGAGNALTRAFEMFQALGHRSGEATASAELGRVRTLSGDYAGAGDALSQALELYREHGERGNEAWALNHYAATFAATGRRIRALALYRQALAMNRELNKPDDEAISLEGIAEHFLATGDLAQGAAHLRQALQIYQCLGLNPDICRVQDQLDDLAAQDRTPRRGTP